ncbi:MFS general substrate transporter [Trichodelitschia bisporula]|uniref:MFS general substrate transporter n=1 Tax=Trichodelitschia bisporula TaxID=703511 RepID=A0A6G1I187_9PEZI|nr:MFS general substrate transporter [Trichodelitschia bisporula]
MRTQNKGSTPGLINPPNATSAPRAESHNGAPPRTCSPVPVRSTRSAGRSESAESVVSGLTAREWTDIKAPVDVKAEKAHHYSDEKYGSEEKIEDSDRPVRTSSPAAAGHAHVELNRCQSLPPPSTVSMQDDGETWYPEGGLQGWLVVLGSFLGMLVAFGFMNTIGVWQTHLTRNQLKGYDESTIGWIFSFYIFLAFVGGIQVGPIVDSKGPKLLLLSGSILIVAAVLLMGVCTQYWHFMLTIGLMAGLGTSLLFTPCIACIGHFFHKTRGNATGIAAAGGSVGGVIFPLMLQRLIPSIGFAWATRALALIFVILCIASVLMVRTRLPPKPGANLIPSMSILRDPAFALTTVAVFCMEWGLFLPITFLASFVLDSGVPGGTQFAFTCLAVLNAGSCVGRYVPGVVADRIGRFNCMLIALVGCMCTVLGLWLPASLLGTNSAGIAHPAAKPVVLVFSVLFGIFSGSNISLTPVCVGQLCDTEEYGRYYSTCYTLVAFGTLTGIPIAGALIQKCAGKYYGVVCFTGACYVMAFLAMGAARVLKVGWRIKGEQGWVIF